MRKLIFTVFFDAIKRVTGFDAAFYLQAYPHIPVRKLLAYRHFIQHGRQEGLLGNSPQLTPGSAAFCETKETVLVVSHDASRSGAPILALNICEELNKPFNVIVLLLKDGSLSPFFDAICYKIIKNGKVAIKSPQIIKGIIKHITQHHNIKFCIANSIESYPVLAPLADNFIPSIVLVHEFLAYTRPVDTFSTALFWAGATVFPASIVQKNALSTRTLKAIQNTHVLPQGKSQIPCVDTEPRPSGSGNPLSHARGSEGTFIVLGAGTVYYRKGVDLFIATAAEIKRLHPEYNIKLVWVGSNPESENNTNYACFLADQVERSGLTDCVEFIDEVADLNGLYNITDLFFLSSRLDPLPNVAIDVMSLGIPLVCFEEGTGIIDVLAQDPETATCMVPYLNVTRAAEKIIELYESPEYYSLIACKMKELAHENFNMKQYVSQLIQLATTQSTISEQEAIDCATLNNTCDFINDFSAPHAIRSDAIRTYVRSWHSQAASFRKPAPGFNRDCYDLHHDCRSRNIEPFADYIRREKPKGPWQDALITPTDSTDYTGNKPKCAIHIHAFYPDLLSDILTRLQFNRLKYNIFISTTEASADHIHAILKNQKINHVDLRIVPNKGRDIGPFLTEFGDALQQYDVIGHIHTKKSLDVNEPDIIKTWVNFLLENLIGGKNRMMDRIITRFKQEPELGLVFADDPNALGWGKNNVFANQLATQIGLDSLPEGRFNFPVGTMFWARPSALKPLFDLGWTWDMYPDEPLPYDGSVLHAIERLIPMVVAHQGFRQAVTYVPGITR